MIYSIPFQVRENGGSLEINGREPRNCMWRIKAPEGKSIHFYFSNVEGENFGSDHACKADMLNIVGSSEAGIITSNLALCGFGFEKPHSNFHYNHSY